MRGRVLMSARDARADRRGWLEARRQGVGASEIAAVLGVSPWSTPYKVYAEKVSTEPPVEESSEVLYWGHVHEHTIAVEAAKRNPGIGRVEPSPGLLQHEDYPHVLATLDRLLAPRRSPRGTPPHALVECKNTSTAMYRHAWADGMPPTYYLMQVVTQLDVTGLPVGYLAAHVGGQRLEVVPVQADPAAARAMFEYVEEWWAQHVETRTPPPLTVADRNLLSQMFPGDTDLKARAATPETLSAFSLYVDAHRRRDEAIEEMEEARFEVCRYLGDHTALSDPDTGNVLATWRPDKRGRRSFLVKDAA